jgi:hypothetical protein
MSWVRATVWVGAPCAFVGLALATGCPDPAGNDPNVPDEWSSDAIARTVADCPRVLPPESACGSVPSYENDVLPVLRRSCLTGCHEPGGVASNQDLSTYRALTHDVTPVLTQILGCIMPPADAGLNAALSASDKMELLQWLVCGFPEN